MRASGEGRDIDLDILERRVRLVFRDDVVGDWARRTYAVMEAAGRDDRSIDLEIVVEGSPDRGGYSIRRPHGEPLTAGEPGECLALVEDALVIELQLLRRDLLFVHAAALQHGSRVFLLPGESGAGKSSLTWALCRRGFRYLSDELAPVDIDGGRLWPFPRALRLKAAPPAPDGVPATALDTGPAYCIPAEHLPGGLATAFAPISEIFFLRSPRPADVPELEELTLAQSVARLATNTLNLLAHPDYGIDGAAEILRNCRCYELGATDLEATCALIRSTLDSSRLADGEQLDL